MPLIEGFDDIITHIKNQEHRIKNQEDRIKELEKRIFELEKEKKEILDKEKLSNKDDKGNT